MSRSDVNPHWIEESAVVQTPGSVRCATFRFGMRDSTSEAFARSQTCQLSLSMASSLYSAYPPKDNSLQIRLRQTQLSSPTPIVQARGCTRDWNNPAKAGRTSTKITAHSTATKRASGSPLGAIKAWKHRMFTITGASTATANGT